MYFEQLPVELRETACSLVAIEQLNAPDLPRKTTEAVLLFDFEVKPMKMGGLRIANCRRVFSADRYGVVGANPSEVGCHT